MKILGNGQKVRSESHRATRDEIRDRRIAKLERRWHFRKLVNLFVLWHVTAVIVWLTAQNSVLSQRWMFLVRPYLVLTGMTQNWSMFSPNPDTTDIYLAAEIKYRDGSVKEWEFPRMVKLGYAERYRHERYRKLVEVTHTDTNRGLWPSMAIWAARQNMKNPANPPVSVVLTRHFRYIPPPGQRIGPFQSFVMLTQPIFPGDLQ